MVITGRREFFDDLEVMSRAAREKYLNEKLHEAVEYAYTYAPAVKDILDGAGVTPADIRTVKDLEKLPITRKTDLISRQKASPPYGGFLTIPPQEVDRVFISPGPIYEPIQHAGIKWFAKSFWAAGFRKGDVVVNTFTYHMSPAGMLFHEAIRDCGATAVPVGTGNTDIQVQTLRDLKVTGFVGTPSFLMTILRRAEEMGLDPRRDFALRRAWFTGEMLPASLRKTFEIDYQIATTQAYAVTEPGGAIAYECSQKAGMHLMDEYVVEIVDTVTGKQLEAGDIGEIVVTPVHNRQWGLIRFGTGDISAYITDDCRCGRTANRLIGILWRTGDAVKVRGMFVVSRQAEQVVMGFAPVARFQIVVSRQDNRDEMALKLELKDETADKDALAEELNRRFQDACRIKIDRIEFVAGGNLSDRKIVDERTWK